MKLWIGVLFVFISSLISSAKIFGFPSSYEDELKRTPLAKLIFGYHVDAYYADSEAEFNVSRIFSEYTPTNKNFIDFLNKNTKSGDSALRFRVYFSGLPYALEDKVLEKLELNMDQTLAQIRSFRTQQITAMVNQAIASNPAFANLAPEQVAAIRQQLLNQGLTQLNQALAAARTESLHLFEERYDQVKLETSIQKVTADFITQTDDNNQIYFVIGKDRVNSHLGSEGVGDAIVADWNERTGGSASTGIITIGNRKEVDGFGTLIAEITVFKSRVPFVTPTQYLANVIQLPEQEFENQKDFWKLDSVQGLAGIENEKIRGTLAIADHDGKITKTVRGDVFLTTKDTLSGVYYSGDRGYLDHGYTATYSRKLSERLAGYMGVRRYYDFNNPYTTVAEADGIREGFLGARYVFRQTNLSEGTLKVEYVKGKNSTTKESFSEPYIGFSYMRIWD